MGAVKDVQQIVIFQQVVHVARAVTTVVAQVEGPLALGSRRLCCLRGARIGQRVAGCQLRMLPQFGGRHNRLGPNGKRHESMKKEHKKTLHKRAFLVIGVQRYEILPIFLSV